MDIVNTFFKKVDNTITSFLSNQFHLWSPSYISCYGPRLSPKLPRVVRDLFNNNYFRFSVILLVIYMSNKRSFNGINNNDCIYINNESCQLSRNKRKFPR